MGGGHLAVKLFVWVNPYEVRYGGSMLYAVAEDEQQARALIAKETPRFSYGDFAKPPLLFNDLLGPPDRVLDVPCAEVYEWQE